MNRSSIRRYIWMVEKNSLSSGEFSIRISSTLSFLFCLHFCSLSESVPIKKRNRGIGNRCSTSLKAAGILQMNWGDLVSPNPGFIHPLVCVKRGRREVFQEGGRGTSLQAREFNAVKKRRFAACDWIVLQYESKYQLDECRWTEIKKHWRKTEISVLESSLNTQESRQLKMVKKIVKRISVQDSVLFS